MSIAIITPTEQAADMPPVERLLYLIQERHSIYLKRQAGWPRPWTDNPVLQRHSFTNIYRELDRTTVWIREHIREPFADHPHLWFMLCLARWINRAETLQAMMDAEVWPTNEWDGEAAAAILEQMIARGETIEGAAYMLRAESNPRAEWYRWSKQRYICQVVLGRVWERRDGFVAVAERQSLEAATNWLSGFYGWGAFMAYEVVTDLRHTRYLRNARDIMTWANAGPGAIRGLNRIHGREMDRRISPEQSLDEMRDLLSIVRRRLPEMRGWIYRATELRPQMPTFELRDVEMCLCEFSKFEKGLFGLGKIKRRYPGGP